jgi:hypothetical protein
MSDSGSRRGSPIGARLRGGWERLWAASGVLTVVLFAGGLLFADILGTSNYPPLDASASHVRAYFLENASEVRALSLFHVLSSLALSPSRHTSTATYGVKAARHRRSQRSR